METRLTTAESHEEYTAYGIVNAVDAANILIYAAIVGAEGKADWEMILGADEV